MDGKRGKVLTRRTMDCMRMLRDSTERYKRINTSKTRSGETWHSPESGDVGSQEEEDCANDRKRRREAHVGQ